MTSRGEAPTSGDAEPAPPGLSRKELRDRALESRNPDKCVFGRLPNKTQGGEIDDALRREYEERTRLGVAYQFLAVEDIPDNERNNALTDYLNYKGPGGAVNLRQDVDALRFGILPQGSNPAGRIASRIRAFVKKHELSDSTLTVLKAIENRLEKIADDTDSIEDEQEEFADDEQVEIVESRLRTEEGLKGCPGIYVFTYPQYLRHPIHKSSEFEKAPDRIYLKVGYTTDGSILERVNQETSGAGIPEHRSILRAYIAKDGDDSLYYKVEQYFHQLLDAAGHAGAKRGSTKRMKGGTEWFITSLEFLDTIAELLELDVIVIRAAENE